MADNARIIRDFIAAWPRRDADELAANPGLAMMFSEGFTRIVAAEDYATAETTQKALSAGLIKEVLFGRNEPPLHHYHNTFREALGMEPLPFLT